MGHGSLTGSKEYAHRYQKEFFHPTDNLLRNLEVGVRYVIWKTGSIQGIHKSHVYKVYTKEWCGFKR